MRQHCPVVLVFGALMAASLAAGSAPPGDLPTEAADLIRRAGSAATEDERLTALHDLQGQSGLDPSFRKDLDAFVRFVERWNTDPRVGGSSPSVATRDRTHQFPPGLA